LREAQAAARLLQEDFDVPVDVWSVTSFNVLRREGMEVDRWNRLHPDEEPRNSYVESCFADSEGPFIAATDFMAAVPDQIRQWIPGRYVTLGTDGFGRSDGREALRKHFEVDRHQIVVAALDALASDGKIDRVTVARAIEQYQLDGDKLDPVKD
jgi:pyruvate dehydrogenase E1 component